MNIGAIKPNTTENGSGVRVSLFVSGCDLHCKGCQNSEFWAFNAGREFVINDLINIEQLVKRPECAGLSILGGEPLHPRNLREVGRIAWYIKRHCPDKTIWLYTGYLWEEVKDLPIMEYIDIVVDGAYLEAKRNLMLPFRGSSNQRIIEVKSGKEIS